MGSRSVGEVVGARVKRARETRPWTQKQLVERLAELGHPMNRVTLSKLERPGSTRSKNVSLVDVLALAAALDTPPSLLFLPLGEDDRVAITPTIEIHPDRAQEWIEGNSPLTTTGHFAINLVEWNRAVVPLHMFQHLRDLQLQVHEARARLKRAERLGGADEAPRTKYVAALMSLAEHVQTMRDHGLRTAGILTEVDYDDMGNFDIEIARED